MGIIAKYSLAFVIACLLLFSASAQTPQYAFRVSFRDKQATTLSLGNPLAYLSQRAIDRRTKYNIPIDSTDLPVVASYIDSVLQVTQGVLHVTSRWENTCVVLLEDSANILGLQNIAFIDAVRRIAYYDQGLHQRPLPDDQGQGTGSVPGTGGKPTDFDQAFYGSAWSQIHLCNGEYLHEKGKMGEDMLIAVIDVGFSNANALAAFDSLFQQNRLADAWNFIYNIADVYNTSYGNHGTRVLSCMASYMPQIHVGTAPKARYALYATDALNTEQATELDNFIAAAERADSIGADLITSSVGYNTFDDPSNSYAYSDLDGHTTIPAQAVNAAVKKGIFVLASAGNEGSTSWQHILTPGDADSAMTIGSVDNMKVLASSSGKGPNASGILKPNVCGQGVSASVVWDDGSIGPSSGTSLATPVIAGLTACLMQAFPNKHPIEIRSLIESVSDHFSAPDNNYGNGVPDFKAAYDITGIQEVDPGKPLLFSVYPNPAHDRVFVEAEQNKLLPVTYSILDIQGKMLAEGAIKAGTGIDTRMLPAGLYVLKLSNSRTSGALKLLIR